MKITTLSLLFLFALAGNLVAQVSLVKDIMPGPGDGFQDSAKAGIAYNGKYIFAADGPEGNELWISDGTSAGTTILKDIHSTGGSNPGNFLVEFDKVYFAATSSGFGRELWVTDGTSDGTLQVSDLAQGTDNSDPNLGGRLGDFLYFGANGGPEGHELWRVDTSNLVTFFKDLNTFNSGWPRNFTTVGEFMFFTANALDVTDPDYDENEPFITDGTVEGTRQFYDITFHPNGADIREFTPFQGSVYFLADGFGGPPHIRHQLFITENNGDNTYEYSPFGGLQWLMQVGDYLIWILGDNLYSYDGLFSSPIAKATNPEGYADPIPGVTIGNKLAFPAADPNESTGIELYFTEGTFENNGVVSDIYPGEGSSDPRHIVNLDGKVYFAASPNDTNRELFVSDGTSAGTYMAADVNPGPGGSFPTSLAVVDSTIFFFAYTPETGIELFKYLPQLSGIAEPAFIPFSGRIYPQPCSTEQGVIHVEWDSQQIWKSAELSDLNGRIIQRMDVENRSEIHMSVAKLMPGIYQLTLSNGIQSSAIQVSIQ